MTDWLLLVRRTRRRLILAIGRDAFLDALFLWTGAACCLLLLDRIRWELWQGPGVLSTPEGLGWTGASVLFLSLSAATMSTWRRQPSSLAVAKWIDDRYRLEDRLNHGLDVHENRPNLSGRGGGDGRRVKDGDDSSGRGRKNTQPTTSNNQQTTNDQRPTPNPRPAASEAVTSVEWAEAHRRDLETRLKAAPLVRLIPRLPVGYRWGSLLGVAIAAYLVLVPPEFERERRARDRREAGGRRPGSVHPWAKFWADRQEGGAPLAVQFLNQSEGVIERYVWDFGDGTPEAHQAHPVHVFLRPGVYTVRLRAVGSVSCDERVRERYIRVAGGSPLAAVSPLMPEPSKGGGGDGKGESGGGGGRDGAGKGTKDPFGDPERTPVTLTPKEVDPLVEREGATKKRKVDLYAPDAGGAAAPGGPGKGEPKPFEEIYTAYRRQAEDTMRAENIPPEEKDLIRRYFEAIKP